MVGGKFLRSGENFEGWTKIFMVGLKFNEGRVKFFRVDRGLDRGLWKNNRRVGAVQGLLKSGKEPT